MRGLLIAALVALPSALLGLPTPARAGDPAEADRLVAEGVALGEAGEYRAAIERFAAAEQAASRPVHDCNIGLAWIGLKKPATAFFFIDRCQQRARADLPPWVAEQHAALKAQLDAAGHVRVRITSTPPGALLNIDTLPGAEPRTPVTLRLPATPMTLTGRINGFLLTERAFEVPPARIELRLRRPVAAAPMSTAPISEAPPAAPPPAMVSAPPAVEPAVVATAAPADRTLAWTLLGTGALTAAAGGYFLYAAHDEADAAYAASERRDVGAMNAAKDATRLNEGLAYGAFGLAAIALTWGAWALLADDAAEVALIPVGAGLGLRVRLP